MSPLHGDLDSYKITTTPPFSMKLPYFLGGIDVVEGMVCLE
jgi:hypothetical protein